MALSEDGCLQQLNLKCSIDKQIKDMMSTMSSFGSVSIETSPPSVVIKTMKATQAQIMSVIIPPSVKSINDIKFTLHNIFNIPKGKRYICITGCIVCPNGKMVFVDWYKRRLLILNDDGTLDKEIPCSLGQPCDVTYLEDTTVAVSTNKGIAIINIDTNNSERNINTSQGCHGKTYHSGVLLRCEEQKGIHMMKLSDDIITTLVKQSNFPPDSYLTAGGEKIYQADRNTSTVTCYTINGDKLSEYKNESMLKNPRGVTVDNNSNAYVTSCRSNSVVFIEPNGRQDRHILSSEDGLKQPWGMYFDKSKNSLIVANFSEPCFLYQKC